MTVGNVSFSKGFIPLQKICRAMGKGASKIFSSIKGVKNSKAEMKSLASQAPLVNGLPGDKNHTHIYLNQPNDVKASVVHEPIYAQINVRPKLDSAERFLQTALADNSSYTVKSVIDNKYLLKAVVNFTGAVHDLRIKDEKCLFARARLYERLSNIGKDSEKEKILETIREIKTDLRDKDKLVTGKYPQKFNDAFEVFESSFRPESKA